MASESTTPQTDRRRIAKDTCLMVCDLLAQYGVRHVVLSPGSRNAPMVVAMMRSGLFKCSVIIDERSAAFAALGMSLASSEPVAIVCTSGTALLNYAPAVAEAFYRRVPLVVISADRPAQWIDQDDSQTIRQTGSLANFIRGQVDVSESIYASHEGPWWLNRRLNDVLSAGIEGPLRGPVHINLQLGEPLTALVPSDTPRVHGARIPLVRPTVAQLCLPTDLIAQFRATPEVLVILGFMNPDPELPALIARLARSGCVILKEAQSNVRCLDYPNVLPCIDSTLKMVRRISASTAADFRPRLVISIGGALLSRHIKAYLRTCTPTPEVWCVGPHDHAVDAFKARLTRIEMPALDFLRSLAADPGSHSESYAALWRQAAETSDAEAYAESSPWSDFKAVSTLLSLAPEGLNLQVSNGTAIRYVQLFRDHEKFNTVHCNRGVSGIDGSTSTALGFASVASQPTLLLTGDMSAAYDVGALALPCVPPTFRMAVLNNQGGGIFRFIPTTRTLTELEEAFACTPRFPVRALAGAYGFDYLEAASEAELRDVLPRFFSQGSRPCILNIITPPQESAETLLNFFK